MTGTSMPHGTWYGAAAGYLETWMAMMVPMMLPSLVPMLARYRQSVRGVEGMHRHGLTALVGAGYFTIWAVVGVAAYVAGVGLASIEARWGVGTGWLTGASGGVLLAAGAVQLSAWKTRRLALCRSWSFDDCRAAAAAGGAWRQGVELGVRCSLSCGSLMLALLAIGMMKPVAMAAVTLVIWAERLGPAPVRVARLAGVALVGLGLATIVPGIGVQSVGIGE